MTSAEVCDHRERSHSAFSVCSNIRRADSSGLSRIYGAACCSKRLFVRSATNTATRVCRRAPRRPRYFEFAFPRGLYDTIDIGRDSHTEAKADCQFVTVEEAIGDLPELAAGDAFDGRACTRDSETDYQRDRRQDSIALFNHVARTHSRQFLNKISAIQPGQGNAQLPDGERFSDNYFSQAYARLHPERDWFHNHRAFSKSRIGPLHTLPR